MMYPKDLRKLSPTQYLKFHPKESEYVTSSLQLLISTQRSHTPKTNFPEACPAFSGQPCRQTCFPLEVPARPFLSYQPEPGKSPSSLFLACHQKCTHRMNPSRVSQPSSSRSCTNCQAVMPHLVGALSKTKQTNKKPQENADSRGEQALRKEQEKKDGGM